MTVKKKPGKKTIKKASGKKAATKKAAKSASHKKKQKAKKKADEDLFTREKMKQALKIAFKELREKRNVKFGDLGVKKFNFQIDDNNQLVVTIDKTSPLKINNKISLKSISIEARLPKPPVKKIIKGTPPPPETEPGK